MSQYFQIHDETPQFRLVKQAVEILRNGGVIYYPKDSGYALGCVLGNKSGVGRIRAIRRLDDKHNLSLVCADLSDVANYAKVSNINYRLLKAATPGRFTFILNATSVVPRQMMHAKRRTIGIRIPDNAIALALSRELGEPIISTTFIKPGETDPFFDPYEIRSEYAHALDLIVDGGWVAPEPTTVISLLDDVPELMRQGGGDWHAFIAD